MIKRFGHSNGIRWAIFSLLVFLHNNIGLEKSIFSDFIKSFLGVIDY